MNKQSTHPLFGHGNVNEQNLLEDLIIESLHHYGINFFYIPRTLVSKDDILGEDRLSEFKNSYPIEMYFENVESLGGQQFYIQKFGMMVEQTATLVVARRRWNQLIGRYGKTIIPSRPNEGDLIYFPLTNGLFEIKFVDHQNPFYQLGKLYTYKLEVELFQYSSERLNTGIPEIDVFESLKSFDVDVNEDIEVPDNYGRNDEILNTGQSVINFDEHNPFGELQFPIPTITISLNSFTSTSDQITSIFLHKFRLNRETLYTTDNIDIIALNKAINERIILSDNGTWALNKLYFIEDYLDPTYINSLIMGNIPPILSNTPLNETPTFIDNNTINLIKTINETTVFTDTKLIALEKILTETALPSDKQNISLRKNFTETGTVTDTTFINLRSPVNENLSFVDTKNIALSKPLIDTQSVIDSKNIVLDKSVNDAQYINDRIMITLVTSFNETQYIEDAT